MHLKIFFFGENKFSHLHFVSLLWAWVRIPPTTEFFSKLNKSIFLSLLHNQQTKVHNLSKFHTSGYKTNNLDDLFIIFEQNLYITYLTTYVETKQKKKKFSFFKIWSLDLLHCNSPLYLLSYLGKKKIWIKNLQSNGFQKFHKIGGYRHHILRCPHTPGDLAAR